MDRRTLFALIAGRLRRLGGASPVAVLPEARGPEAVYLAARAIRVRIDAALIASRQPPAKGIPR